MNLKGLGILNMIIALLILFALSLGLLYVFDMERRKAVTTFDIVVSVLSEACFLTAAFVLFNTIIITLIK